MSSASEHFGKTNCRLCGEPMPSGEEMFMYHGYSGPCPKPPLPAKTTGVMMIVSERANQLQKWSAQHDESHCSGQLAIVAAELAVNSTYAEISMPELDSWDLELDSWGLIEKHKDSRIKQLTIAGALIAAEIDRLIRAGEES